MFFSSILFVTPLFSWPFVSSVTMFARGWRRTVVDCHTLPTRNFISHIINLGNYAADKYNSVVAPASGWAAMKADATTFRTTVRAANSRFPILLRCLFLFAVLWNTTTEARFRRNTTRRVQIATYRCKIEHRCVDYIAYVHNSHEQTLASYFTVVNLLLLLYHASTMPCNILENVERKVEFNVGSHRSSWWLQDCWNLLLE